MKPFEVLVIGTYITRKVMADNAKEAKEKARLLLPGIPSTMKLKATELQGHFA